MGHNHKQETWNFLLKKRILIAAFFFRMFLAGVEYSVILPTALLYVNSLSGNAITMGLVIGIYPFAAVIALPLIGYIYDRTLRMRELFILLNFCQIVGSIIYALPYSVWCPIIGRMIAGFGDSSAALTTGEVTFLYPASVRISMLSLLELGRVFGLILGPSINVFISNKSYVLSTWLLDKKTLPGVIMAIGWLILQVITIFGVYNLGLEVSQQHNDQSKQDNLSTSKEEDSLNLLEYDSKPSSIGTTVSTNTCTSDFDDEEDEAEGHLTEFLPKMTTNEKFTYKQGDRNKDHNSSFKYYWSSLSEIFALEFFTIFYVDQVLGFVQTSLEIFLPYITEFDYHWTSAKTGIIYTIGGVELLLIFFTLFILGQKFTLNDSYLMLLSVILTLVALAFLICETTLTEISKRQIAFFIATIFTLGTIPFNLVCSKSLLTKMMKPELQGIVQGIFGSAGKISLVTGPLISSLMFTNRQVYASVLSLLCFFALVLLLSSLSRIKKRIKSVAIGL